MTKFELVGRIMSIGSENKGAKAEIKAKAKEECVKLLDEFLAFTQNDIITNESDVCKHEYRTFGDKESERERWCIKCLKAI